MIETLFASINGYTTVPGKANFYPKKREEDRYNKIRVSQGDSLELVYENAFYDPSFTPSNVQLADPATIISAVDYGTWSYNILLPQGFIFGMLRDQGMNTSYLSAGREGLVIQQALDPLYNMYKNQGYTDKLKDFINWMVMQINGYQGLADKSIFISSHTFPSVRKIQYIDQDNSKIADTDQGTQFGISDTTYKLRKVAKPGEGTSEIFYRLSIEAVTRPSIFEANKNRTDLTFDSFDVGGLRIDDFYVVHPKTRISNVLTPVELTSFSVNKSITVQLDGALNKVERTNHGFISGDEFYFRLFKNTTGLGLNRVYYAVNIESDAFKVATQPSGVGQEFGNPSAGKGEATLVYQTQSPLTISNYPTFSVEFGNSLDFVRPTSADYGKKEDVCIINRSRSLQESIYKFVNINNLPIALSGDVYLQGSLPKSASGYRYTGDTFGFFLNEAMDYNSPTSGLFDQIVSGDGKVIQVGTISSKTSFAGASNMSIREWTYDFYNVNAATGKFKSTNETGFFNTQGAIDSVEKSGVYMVLKRDIDSYIAFNYGRAIETLRTAIEASPEVWAFRETVKIANGVYGGHNPYYDPSQPSGKFATANLTHYLFVETDGLDPVTKTANIKGFFLKPEYDWKPTADAVLALGMTGNTYVRKGFSL